MPTIFTQHAATPNAIRYSVGGTDATAGVISQAAVVADCAAGPLKQFLVSLSTAQWNALERNLAMTVTVQPTVEDNPLAAQFTGGNLSVLPANAANSAGMITLRYHPSRVR